MVRVAWEKMEDAGKCVADKVKQIVSDGLGTGGKGDAVVDMSDDGGETI